MSLRRIRSTPPARLTDADDLPIGLIDVELSKPPIELVGDTAAVLLRPGEGPPTIRPFDDAERPDLTERVGYGSAGTPPGDFTSPTRETPRGARPKLFVRPR